MFYSLNFKPVSVEDKQHHNHYHKEHRGGENQPAHVRPDERVLLLAAQKHWPHDLALLSRRRGIRRPDRLIRGVNINIRKLLGARRRGSGVHRPYLSTIRPSR